LIADQSISGSMLRHNFNRLEPIKEYNNKDSDSSKTEGDTDNIETQAV